MHKKDWQTDAHEYIYMSGLGSPHVIDSDDEDIMGLQNTGF